MSRAAVQADEEDRSHQSKSSTMEGVNVTKLGSGSSRNGDCPIIDSPSVKPSILGVYELYNNRPIQYKLLQKAFINPL